MGYIEDRAAEGQRQAFEAAKRAEAGRVLNQGVAPSGLAGIRSEGYAEGLSPEDAYKLQLVKQAQDANHDVAVADMIAKNRAYNAIATEAANNLKNGVSVDADQMNALRQYKESIDAGLAAKWRADRANFK